ncbi:MAG: peptidase M14, partial [Gammaproteobacteria bacterium]
MAELCPAVTLECGKVGDAGGVSHAAEFIDACLHLTQLPEQPIRPEDIHLFHTVARIEVPEQTSFGFGDSPADIVFSEDLEYYNFTELSAGTVIGHYNNENAPHLAVVDESGHEIERRFLYYSDGKITLAKDVMPSMLTLNAENIRQDCLCYFMERYPLPE